MSVITLTTDFGTRDWFVGTMKGVILTLNPRARIVDLTHEVPPGDILAGAFALASSYRFFPQGTIHVAIVDPGVGSSRKAIIAQTEHGCFIGPDNGVLSWALRHEKVTSVHALESAKYFLEDVSRTFHGRDVFAPVAAHASRGVPVSRFGPRLRDYVRLNWPEPRRNRDRLEGEVIYIDRFGNAITNLDAAQLRAASRLPGGRTAVYVGRRRLCGIGEYYQCVARGEAVAVAGSSGFMEIAVNGGSAARNFDLQIGTPITLR